jgi:hypothetical protein
MGKLGFSKINTREVTVRLQAAEKPSKALKVLQGKVTGTIQIPLGALVEVKDIFKASKQVIQGKEGASLQVLQAGQKKTGAIQVQVKLTTASDIIPAVTHDDLFKPLALGAAPPGPGRPLPPLALGLPKFTGFALLDDRDQPVPLTDVTSTESVSGNKVTRQVTLTFQPTKGQGAPTKLRFTGVRVATVAVPFKLNGLSLR